MRDYIDAVRSYRTARDVQQRQNALGGYTAPHATQTIHGKFPGKGLQMSDLLLDFPPDTYFELGEMVYFDHGEYRLKGEVVRVYNTRAVYHVEVDGKRYRVRLSDNPRRDR